MSLLPRGVRPRQASAHKANRRAQAWIGAIRACAHPSHPWVARQPAAPPQRCPSALAAAGAANGRWRTQCPSPPWPWASRARLFDPQKRGGPLAQAGTAPKRRCGAGPRNRPCPTWRPWPWQAPGGPACTRRMPVTPHGRRTVHRAMAAHPRAAVTMPRRWPPAWATRPPARRLTARAERCSRPWHPAASEARQETGTARRPTTRETTSQGWAASSVQAMARRTVPGWGHCGRACHTPAAANSRGASRA